MCYLERKQRNSSGQQQNESNDSQFGPTLPYSSRYIGGTGEIYYYKNMIVTIKAK